ncbi:MAG: flagellar export chaperone FliS [Planctomycetota bacterium]
MNPQDASQAYLTATVENAPPIQIIRLLYQGALRFLGQAEHHPDGIGSPAVAQLIRQAADIVIELRLALDFDAVEDKAVPSNLERLYLFCEDELFRAELEKTFEPVKNVRNVLEVLLDAWRQIELDGSQAA